MSHFTPVISIVVALNRPRITKIFIKRSLFFSRGVLHITFADGSQYKERFVIHRGNEYAALYSQLYHFRLRYPSAILDLDELTLLHIYSTIDQVNAILTQALNVPQKKHYLKDYFYTV